MEKSFRSKTSFAGIIFALFLALTLSARFQKSGFCLAGEEKDPFPFDEFKMLSGETIPVKELLGEGKGLFLNFWGLHCQSCLDEIEELNLIYDAIAATGKIEFIAVNADGISGEALKKEMADHAIEVRFPVVIDPTMEITEFFTDGFVPHNVIIYPRGVEVFEITGFNRKVFSEIEKRLSEITAAR